MKLENFIIIFLIVMLCLFTPLLYRSMLSSQVAIETNSYSEYITTACYDAMGNAEMINGYCFASEIQRDKVVDAFYMSLSECFNYKSDIQKHLLQYYVPCIAMIDTDGFYISYTQQVVAPDGSFGYIEYTTPITKWTDTFGQYRIVYRLDNRIELTDMGTNTTLNGTYSDVYIQLVNYCNANGIGYPTALNFLANDQEFADTKNNTIVTATVKQIEYYINAHNDLYNNYDAKYRFELPRVEGEDWARLLKNPTVISFLQGMQASYGSDYLNVYSMAGAELTKALTYDISRDATGTLYYHEHGCPYNTGTLRTDTMKKCASNGAEPCPHCIWTN